MKQENKIQFNEQSLIVNISIAILLTVGYVTLVVGCLGLVWGLFTIKVSSYLVVLSSVLTFSAYNLRFTINTNV